MVYYIYRGVGDGIYIGWGGSVYIGGNELILHILNESKSYSNYYLLKVPNLTL